MTYSLSRSYLPRFGPVIGRNNAQCERVLGIEQMYFRSHRLDLSIGDSYSTRTFVQHRGFDMEPRISIITLGVSNMERSHKFYRDGLGLPTKDEGEGIVFFQLQGTWLALYPREKLAEDVTVLPDGHGFSGVTLAHNTRTREEVDAVLAEAEAAGATIVKPAQDVFWGGYSGYFTDPDGHLWEVAWNPQFEIE